MSSITETSEHKALRDSYTKAFYVTGQHYAGQIGVAFDKGSETTERLLTAQHDKEIIELLNWIERARWEPYETGFFAKYGWNVETEYKTPAELLQLFRNRNK